MGGGWRGSARGRRHQFDICVDVLLACMVGVVTGLIFAEASVVPDMQVARSVHDRWDAAERCGHRDLGAARSLDLNQSDNMTLPPRTLPAGPAASTRVLASQVTYACMRCTAPRKNDQGAIACLVCMLGTSDTHSLSESNITPGRTLPRNAAFVLGLAFRFCVRSIVLGFCSVISSLRCFGHDPRNRTRMSSSADR